MSSDRNLKLGPISCYGRIKHGTPGRILQGFGRFFARIPSSSFGPFWHIFGIRDLGLVRDSDFGTKMGVSFLLGQEITNITDCKQKKPVMNFMNL